MNPWASQFGLGATNPSDPMCATGRAAALLPITDPQFQTYFGTPSRVQAFTNQCGAITLPSGAPYSATDPFSGSGGGGGGGKTCPPGWTTIGSIPAGTCQPVEHAAPTGGAVVCTPDQIVAGYIVDPISGFCVPGESSGPITIPTPIPIKIPINPSPSPTCIGANYTVNAQGQCVYPAGGPSIYNSPPLVFTDTTGQFASAPQAPIVCAGGVQPDFLGNCPVASASQAPSTLQTIEQYFSNPWVLGGAAVLIYLMTRKKSRRR